MVNWLTDSFANHFVVVTFNGKRHTCTEIDFSDFVISKAYVALVGSSIKVDTGIVFATYFYKLITYPYIAFGGKYR